MSRRNFFSVYLSVITFLIKKNMGKTKKNEPNLMKKKSSNHQFEAQRKIPCIIKNCLYKKMKD